MIRNVHVLWTICVNGLTVLFTFCSFHSLHAEATIYLQVGEAVVLTSPNFPNNYSNNANMMWNIIAPSQDYGVLVNFTHFHLEQCCDYLSVYAGSTPSFRDSALIGEYLGSSLPANIESRHMYLWISFTSDGSVVYSGFEIEVSAFDLTGTIYTILHLR